METADSKRSLGGVLARRGFPQISRSCQKIVKSVSGDVKKKGVKVKTLAALSFLMDRRQPQFLQRAPGALKRMECWKLWVGRVQREEPLKAPREQARKEKSSTDFRSARTKRWSSSRRA